MSHTKPIARKCTPPYEVDTSQDTFSRYGGILAWKESWHRLGIEKILTQAQIHYGCSGDKAPEMSYLLTTAPFVNATSQRRVSQRFGGEASEHEADALLPQQLTHTIDQRTLNRFSNTARYDWLAVQKAHIEQLQRLPAYKANRKGVVIIDDWPLLKPYAREMPYLSPIWDNNLKCALPGYAIVHLYYHHPLLPSYSLAMWPWLKTSLTGETKSKNQARRPAREGEEMSKLDIAFMLVQQLLDNLSFSALVFDNWYTTRWFLHALTEAGHAWIGDASAHQKFVVGGQYLTVAEIYDRYRHQLRRVPGQKRQVKAVSLSAHIKPDQYTKVSQTVQLVLVTGLHQPRDKDKGYKVLVCNRPQWTTRRIVRLFSYRPQIEAAHRHGKQVAGWLDFHARSVPALLCHLTFCMIRCHVLFFMQRCTQAAAQWSPRQVVEHLIGCVVRLVHHRLRGWIPHLKPDEPLWSYYRRKTMVFY